jgi:hypothetical protein
MDGQNWPSEIRDFFAYKTSFIVGENLRRFIIAFSCKNRMYNLSKHTQKKNNNNKLNNLMKITL